MALVRRALLVSRQTLPATHSGGRALSRRGPKALTFTFTASAAPAHYKMPSRYNRYALETKLRVLEVARRGGGWEETVEDFGVNYNTARVWVRRHVTHGEEVRVLPRGGKRDGKVTDSCVQFWLGKLREDPDLTLRQLADALEHERGVYVVPQTVKNHVDGACFTLKQMHKEPQYMNTMTNKQKRRVYLHQLQQYEAMGKVILYMDKTNFNLWSSRTRGRSLRGRRAVKKLFAGGGQNMHVIACISENGLVHYETKFGSNRHANTNDFIRALLRRIRDSSEHTLADMVLVIDNAPCHCRAESVFEEGKFLDATLLRLGPYSPMLNPIENVFSMFKASVKAFLREQRRAILSVPNGVTMKYHHQAFLHTAANRCLPEVTTAASSRSSTGTRCASIRGLATSRTCPSGTGSLARLHLFY
ncbi:hypothetical protein PC123_g20123 [Phytophthora cactorum]|nr:hypothetical protein PC123_g20123 [Phytophthora cactorum]